MEERLTTGPVISVIVPVYNASRYLTACLDAVRRQSFDDFEVLLIDDGSTEISVRNTARKTPGSSSYTKPTKDLLKPGTAGLS